MKRAALKSRSFYGILFLTFFSLTNIFAQPDFSNYPWLNDIVDVEDCCNNQTITAYQSGIFSFIYVENSNVCQEEGNVLYFQDGTFYCQDINGMNCRAAYGLTEDNATVLWDCSVEETLDQAWLQDYLEQDCTGDIYTVDYNGSKGIYISTQCACVDDVDRLYTSTGELLCTLGGLQNPEHACDANILEQLNTKNLIWSPECGCPCPVDFSPVCGADGQMYESRCEATCAGIAIIGPGDCEPTSVGCKPLDALNLNPGFCQSCIGEVAIYTYKGAEYVVTSDDNTQCTDGITVVTHCDSTTVFCYQGGIAGFNQCTEFFEEAVKTEIKWSRAKDCTNTIEIAPPCTDLAGVDFGLCEAIMGVGLVEGKCITVSGCLNYEINGVDYKKAFFPTVDLCQQNCDEAIIIIEPPVLFDEFDWLGDLIDPFDCVGAKVEVYNLGAYSYLHLETAESGQLFFEDGTFYCMDQANYDCRALYNLGVDQITNEWACNSEQSGFQTPENSLIQTRISTPWLITSISAFPNPTNGLVQVKIEGDLKGESLLTVYDLQGRLLQQKQLSELGNKELVSLDLSSEMAGIYFVEWQAEGGKEIIKVVKL